jgi:3-phenylpropionate/trans-cinnamate dioxygenase ferredoxin reductase subunit
MNPLRHVIIGTGLAGLRAAEAIRSTGDEGDIIMVGAEHEPPYSRPPLSKEFLAGELREPELLLRSLNFYSQQRIDLRLGVSAVSLDLSTRRVELASGERLAFDRLLIASGSEPRRLAVEGAGLAGIHALRTYRDAAALADALRDASRVVVVGAGLVGLEVAATARQAGKEVTLVEAHRTALSRVLGGGPLGDAVLDLHRAQGVQVLTSTTVQAFRGQRRVQEVVLVDGTVLPADVVVVGVGVRPAIDWLRGSGLVLGDGVPVDAYTETAVPGIFAAGDVASMMDPLSGRRMRLEQNGHAHAQGACAGRAMAGRPEPYSPLPSVSSTQFGRRLQVLGHLRGDEEFIPRGRREEPGFTACFLRGDRLTGAFAIDRPRDILALRPLISSGLTFPRELLADPSVDLQRLSQQHVKTHASPSLDAPVVPRPAAGRPAWTLQQGAAPHSLLHS